MITLPFHLHRSTNMNYFTYTSQQNQLNIFSLREVSADLGVILAAHVEEVMDKGNDEQPTPPNLINVRRTHVLDDGLKKN